MAKSNLIISTMKWTMQSHTYTYCSQN